MNFIREFFGAISELRKRFADAQPPPTAAPVERRSDPMPGKPIVEAVVVGWLSALIERCRELGRGTAKATRALKVDATVLAGLIEVVTAWARAATPPPYDPAAPLDKRTAAALEQLDEQAVEHKTLGGLAEAELRKREEELAKLGALPPFPKPSETMQLTAGAAITCSLALVLHDYLTGLPVPLRWSLAILFAASFAIFMISAALPAISPSEAHAAQEPGMSRGVFISCLITSLAFFGARLALAKTYGDLMVAASSALMEIGVLIYVEKRGNQLWVDRNGWCVKRDIRATAQALRDIALKTRDAHKEALAQVKALIAEIEIDVIRPRVQDTDIDRNIELCVAAMRGAYIAQVTANKAIGIVPEENN